MPLIVCLLQWFQHGVLASSGDWLTRKRSYSVLVWWVVYHSLDTCTGSLNTLSGGQSVFNSISLYQLSNTSKPLTASENYKNRICVDPLPVKNDRLKRLIHLTDDKDQDTIYTEWYSSIMYSIRSCTRKCPNVLLVLNNHSQSHRRQMA